MAPNFVEVQFEQGLPLFHQIRDRFAEFTGIEIGIKATLNLTELRHPQQLTTLLCKDQNKVEALFEERDNFYSAHPEEYELMAGKRDAINARLRPLTYIKELRFDIFNFYEVDFWIKNDILTYGIYGTEYYAVEALAKVLYDLGGTFKDEKSMSERLRRWSKLKRWDDYNRFNKPTK